jgi:hypothetical protein
MVIPLIFPSTLIAAAAHSTKSDINETNLSFPSTSACCASRKFLLRQQVGSCAYRSVLSSSGALNISLSTKNYYYHNDSNPVTSRAGHHGSAFQFMLLHQRRGSAKIEVPSSLQGVRTGTDTGTGSRSRSPFRKIIRCLLFCRPS